MSVNSTVARTRSGSGSASTAVENRDEETARPRLATRCQSPRGIHVWPRRVALRNVRTGIPPRPSSARPRLETRPSRPVKDESRNANRRQDVTDIDLEVHQAEPRGLSPGLALWRSRDCKCSSPVGDGSALPEPSRALARSFPNAGRRPRARGSPRRASDRREVGCPREPRPASHRERAPACAPDTSQRRGCSSVRLPTRPRGLRARIPLASMTARTSSMRVSRSAIPATRSEAGATLVEHDQSAERPEATDELPAARSFSSRARRSSQRPAPARRRRPRRSQPDRQSRRLLLIA